MRDLIAIAFDTKPEADAALADAVSMQQKGLLDIADAVVVEKKPSGKVKLHQTVDVAAPFMANGMFWGLLVGLLLGVPLLGGLTGVAMGGVSGLLTDLGVDDNFMKTLGRRLTPGTAALFLLVRDNKIDRVLEEVRGWHGEMLHTSLSRDVEATLRGALATELQGEATMPSPSTAIAASRGHNDHGASA